MSYRDLQKLKRRIHTLGNNIRQQENFYGDINEFLQQVYHPEELKGHKYAAQTHVVPVTAK